MSVEPQPNRVCLTQMNLLLHRERAIIVTLKVNPLKEKMLIMNFIRMNDTLIHLCFSWGALTIPLENFTCLAFQAYM